jgi:hypothetical protein
MTGGRSGTSELRAALRKSPSALASVRSWEDFRRHANSLTTTKAKGNAFEALVKAYLLLEPEYASKLKHVWLHREVLGKANGDAQPQQSARGPRPPNTHRPADQIRQDQHTPPVRTSRGTAKAANHAQPPQRPHPNCN